MGLDQNSRRDRDRTFWQVPYEPKSMLVITFQPRILARNMLISPSKVENSTHQNMSPRLIRMLYLHGPGYKISTSSCLKLITVDLEAIL